MKIHEYQAREILRRAGVPVPDWHVVETAHDAASAFETIGKPLSVVKAQVHAGGRGKGGGVKLVKSADEARDVSKTILEKPLVTPQTGPEGTAVHKLLVAEAVDIEKEFYAGVVVDRARGGPVLMTSAEGGVEIEEVAASSPEKILIEPIDPSTGLADFQCRKIAYALGLEGDLIKQASKCFKALCQVFLEEDCSLIEINPLVVTKDGTLLAIDAKANLDDNAAFRHPDWEELKDPHEEDPAERQAQQNGLSYVNLDGSIGCLVNGAGLAMSTMDIIKFYGGEPANFLDVGGGANKDQVSEAFRILLADSKVKAVLVNIFGGIMKCDTIAAAIVAAYEEVGFHIPLVVRLEGTNVELGRKMLDESGHPIIAAADLAEAAQKAVEAVQS